MHWGGIRSQSAIILTPLGTIYGIFMLEPMTDFVPDL